MYDFLVRVSPKNWQSRRIPGRLGLKYTKYIKTHTHTNIVLKYKKVQFVVTKTAPARQRNKGAPDF